MGPVPADRIPIYCTGPDCLCTRYAHFDPVDPRIVLCDYCGKEFALSEREQARRATSGRRTGRTGRG